MVYFLGYFFQTESCCDKVHVYQGDPACTELHLLSGSLSGAEAEVYWHEGVVHFRTDGSVTRSGFRATVQMVDRTTRIMTTRVAEP